MMNIQTKQQPDEVETTSNGKQIINGREFMADAKGHLVPVEMIKPADLLEDEAVRKILGYASKLSKRIARFRSHTFEDLNDFDALLAQEYEVKPRGGAKGNKTYMTFDGLTKVQIQVADFIDFGPQLQIAKELIDECLNEWAADTRPEIRALITRAFNTDKQGQINRADIFMLMRLDIEDERWQRAVEAIRDAMRVVGSKTYVRFYQRKSREANWKAVTIDLAKVSS